MFEKFVKGFYGTLDVSLDDATKGMDGFVAYPYSLVDPANPNSGYVRGPQRGRSTSGGQRGLAAGSCRRTSRYIGYRGSHKIPDYQRRLHLPTRGAAADHACAGR